MKYLLRYSEIGTKAPGTRRRLLRVLEKNVRAALRGSGIIAQVKLSYSRGWVETEDQAAQGVLPRVFGLKSFSPVETLAFKNLKDIVQAGEKRFADLVTGRTFAVRARRVGEHPFTSKDIEEQLGAALFGKSGGVDLNNPEVTAFVEVRDEKAYLFDERIEGPGGLPLTSQGRALVLLSGGFDSAVAAWELMKRGVGVDYCFFNLGGPIHEEGVLRVVSTLTDMWQHGDDAFIVIVPFADVVEEIRKTTRDKYWNLVLKRAMLHAGVKVAKQRKLLAIATGDAVGQVSSQTLRNMNALGEVGLPLLRPLLTRDKDEIVMQARRIGTEKLSAAIQEYCAIVPKHPVTAATPEALLAEWTKLGENVVDAAVKQQRTLSLATLELTEASALSDVTVSDVPEGAKIIDVREQDQFNEWHAQGAERHDIHDAMRAIRTFSKEQSVLFVCEHGLLSAELALMVREQGLSASSFKGGAQALRVQLEAQTRNPKS